VPSPLDSSVSQILLLTRGLLSTAIDRLLDRGTDDPHSSTDSWEVLGPLDCSRTKSCGKTDFLSPGCTRTPAAVETCNSFLPKNLPEGPLLFIIENTLIRTDHFSNSRFFQFFPIYLDLEPDTSLDQRPPRWRTSSFRTGEIGIVKHVHPSWTTAHGV
jgi:hypothetical protein